MTLLAGRLTFAAKGGANATAKVLALIGGMVAGADSIEDMDLLRHDGMPRLFDDVRALEYLGLAVAQLCERGRRVDDDLLAQMSPAQREHAPRGERLAAVAPARPGPGAVDRPPAALPAHPDRELALALLSGHRPGARVHPRAPVGHRDPDRDMPPTNPTTAEAVS